MAEISIRDRKATETRARIGEAALELFVSQGYAETTIDQIAVAAGVGRRTVFRYFPTKEAMAFDQLVMRREVAIERLRERPRSEPPLVSLLVMLRELSEHGYDRRLLTQIWELLAAEPDLAGQKVSLENRAFEHQVVGVLRERAGDVASALEINALTKMALDWFLVAVQIYLIEHRASLAETFDEVVAACQLRVSQLD